MSSCIKESCCIKESYFPDKKNHCDSSNVNVGVQCGDCNNKQEKAACGCYCCVDKLRKIAQLFKEDNTPVLIFTENFNEPNYSYIYDIVNDIIYISNRVGAKPSSFIPLCKIVSIFALRLFPQSEEDEIKEKIMTISSENTQQKMCCSGSGVADIINNIKDFTDSFPVAIPEMDQIDSFFFGVLLPFFYSDLSISANNEFIFYYGTYSIGNSIEAGYLIIPTCKVELVVPVTVGRDSKSQQQIQAILESENRDEILRKMSEKMKGKTLEEMIKVVTENIEDITQDTTKDV